MTVNEIHDMWFFQTGAALGHDDEPALSIGPTAVPPLQAIIVKSICWSVELGPWYAGRLAASSHPSLTSSDDFPMSSPLSTQAYPPPSWWNATLCPVQQLSLDHGLHAPANLPRPTQPCRGLVTTIYCYCQTLLATITLVVPR